MEYRHIRIKTSLDELGLENRLALLAQTGTRVRKDGDTHTLEFQFGIEGYPMIDVMAKINQEVPGLFLIKVKSITSGTSLTTYCELYCQGKKPEEVLRPQLEEMLKVTASHDGSNKDTEDIVEGLA